MRKQTLIWTALPNGRQNSDHLSLSVFLSPRLETDEGGATPSLELFPDFVDWPATIGQAPGGPIRFHVKFANYAQPLPASITSISALSPQRWQAIFDPAMTAVQPYDFVDYSTLPMHTFSVNAVQKYVQTVYRSFGAANPTAPPVLTVGAGGGLQLPAGSPLTTTLAGLAQQSLARTGPIHDARAYYTRPKIAFPFSPTTPTLDFHAAVSALGSFPALLRAFGLVFDLVVPNVPGFTSGNTKVSVIPQWTSSFTGGTETSIDVTPQTACTLAGASFRPTPLGALDYQNGMLDLADTKRFSVTELDVDGAAQRMVGVAQDLVNLHEYESSIDDLDQGSTISLSLPTLRSVGPTIVRNAWASTLQSLTARQTASQAKLQAWLTTPGLPLPVFYAEDVIRGHRIDVFTQSETSPAWRSLNQRDGTYTFGPLGAYLLQVDDEGYVVPGASSAAGTVDNPPPPDIYVHESMARWTGWSLSAPRVGQQIDPDDSVSPHRGNPTAPSTPDANGKISPQMSASFTVPPGTLPKLRFGNQYRYRARAADLAGNGPAPTSIDATTATAAITHYRYQPVVAPILASTAPYTPGQGTLLVALLDDQVNPVQPVGRWLFPPKVAQLLAEEHGMFDGFVLGQPNDPNAAPSGDPNTYQVIVGSPTSIGRDVATLLDVAGVKTDPATNDAPYFPGSVVTTPWFSDPMSAGVGMLGLPGDGPIPTVRSWGGAPWPLAQPLLLELEGGPLAGHTYAPATPYASATETVVLPPASVFDVRLSSSLIDPSLFGVWQWILGGIPSTSVAHFLQLAQEGQIWMLTPYTTLRMAHAVRLPLAPPSFVAPKVVTRPYGATTAQIYDLSFTADKASTSSIDVAARWSDPLDNPSDPANNPVTATVDVHGPAFKLTVPDPNPPLATATPGTVVPPPLPVALGSAPGATHDLGDTKHHFVSYTATASSRFAEFFRQTTQVVFQDTNPVQLSLLGLDPNSVEMIDSGGNEIDAAQFTVDPIGGTVALIDPVAYEDQELTATFIPTVTLGGPQSNMHILASARPAPPKVSHVAPAWQLSGPTGTSTTGIKYRRSGGFLRVYLDRPWFSAGAGEILGVVTLPRAEVTTQPPSDAQARLVTMMGLDPISIADPSLFVTTSPRTFGHTAVVPKVPGRPVYANPPLLPLVEDPSQKYQIYPYGVQFDPASNQWYSDVQVTFTAGQAPPPGYMVRLALVRFQPYAYPGAEVSPVVLATFAQPAVDRSVSVVAPTKTSVRITIGGPAYQGWRPADGTDGDHGATVNDYQDQKSDDIYSYLVPGAKYSSSMAIEVQTQDTSLGLSGELAWKRAPSTSPVMFTAAVNGTIATWSGGVSLPYPIGGPTRMRLRISELDYYAPTTAPTVVDTTLRRPFVTHIPL